MSYSYTLNIGVDKKVNYNSPAPLSVGDELVLLNNDAEDPDDCTIHSTWTVAKIWHQAFHFSESGSVLSFGRIQAKIVRVLPS